MKQFILVLSINLFCMQLVCGESLGSKPKKCPSVEMVKALGVNDALSFGTKWVGFTKSHFDTLEEWSLFVLVSDAQNKEDAIRQSREGVSLFSTVDGPNTNRKGAWVCSYEPNSPAIIVSFAKTPPQFLKM